MKISLLLKLLIKNTLFRKATTLWKSATADWRIQLEKPEPTVELTLSREAASIPSFSFFFLLTSAFIIATLGLLANSISVIIGAMIVTPLMNPIICMAFAIITASWPLYKCSIVTIFLGALWTILMVFLISSGLAIDVVGSEIIIRTSPNMIGLGIVIAAGAAGSFSLTRKSNATSIAGVAIAVAFVPSLGVTGIGLGIGSDIGGRVGLITVSNLDVCMGSLLLFDVNVVGIMFTACLVFLSQTSGNLKKALPTIGIWLYIPILLCRPFTGSMKEFYPDNRVPLMLRQIRKENQGISMQPQLRYVDVKLNQDKAYVTMLRNAPEDLVAEKYLDSAQKRLIESVKQLRNKLRQIVVRITPAEIEKV